MNGCDRWVVPSGLCLYVANGPGLNVLPSPTLHFYRGCMVEQGEMLYVFLVAFAVKPTRTIHQCLLLEPMCSAMKRVRRTAR
jgi:hypothetical protein